MITDFLLDAFTGIVLGLLEPLPVQEFDTSAVRSSAVSVGATASTLNGYAPIGAIGLGVALLLALKLALLAWRAVVFIYHQFWGSN